MAALLAQIRALIARTASDSEEEARTAALVACRLIRDNGLEVVFPAPRAAPPAPASDPARHADTAPPPPPSSPHAARGSGDKGAERVARWKQGRGQRKASPDLASVIGKAAGDVASNVLTNAIRKGFKR